MTFKKSTILSPQQDVSTFLQSKDKSSASTVSTVSTASTSSHLSDESSYSVSERSEPQSSTSQRSKSKGSAHVAISRLPSRVKTSKFSSIHSSARSNSDLKLHKRNPHTVLVSQNKDTGLWMTKTETMTNSKNLIRPVAIHKSEHDAVQYAIANAPPKLVSCEESKRCFQCDFMLHSRRRQAVNCRNCGVCICSSCSVSWNRTMVPSTFLAKNSPNKINVCKTCDYLATEFRHALLDGSLKYAKKLYETNNINLRCPLSNLKNGIEIMHPVHCAVSSGNLELVRWLVDEHKCPLQKATASKGPVVKANSGVSFNYNVNAGQLIQTSNGRTILDIALEDTNIDLLHYVLKEKKLKFTSRNDQKASAKALQLIEVSGYTSNRNSSQISGGSGNGYITKSDFNDIIVNNNDQKSVVSALSSVNINSIPGNILKELQKGDQNQNQNHIQVVNFGHQENIPQTVLDEMNIQNELDDFSQLRSMIVKEQSKGNMSMEEMMKAIMEEKSKDKMKNKMKDKMELKEEGKKEEKNQKEGKKMRKVKKVMKEVKNEDSDQCCSLSFKFLDDEVSVVSCGYPFGWGGEE